MFIAVNAFTVLAVPSLLWCAHIDDHQHIGEDLRRGGWCRKIFTDITLAQRLRRKYTVARRFQIDREAAAALPANMSISA